MNVIVALEHRYETTPDGKVWTPDQFAHPFWSRYLDVFSHVRVVARVRQVTAAAPGWARVDGPGVSLFPVTYYVGPWQYLRRRRYVRADLRCALGPTDAVILRVGSQIAACLEPQLRRFGRPYGVEVVTDPYDIYAPGALHHPLRPFFRWWFPRQLRRQCARACAAAYVTEQALQRRYPPGAGAYTTYYSSVELPEAAFASSHRPDHRAESPIRLVGVGTLEQLYKAPDVLLDAVGICVRDGIDLELVWVGGGKHQPRLEAQAQVLGIKPRVHFLGQLPAGEAVRAELDRAHLFVLPSHQEGLPRAMIEAMARALPCIGSTVGGIPELLPAEDLVPPGDAGALAHKIREVVGDPERMARMSARNLGKADEYRDEALRERRLAFYRHLRERTEIWSRGKRRGHHPVDRPEVSHDTESLSQPRFPLLCGNSSIPSPVPSKLRDGASTACVGKPHSARNAPLTSIISGT